VARSAWHAEIPLINLRSSASTGIDSPMAEAGDFCRGDTRSCVGQSTAWIRPGLPEGECRLWFTMKEVPCRAQWDADVGTRQTQADRRWPRGSDDECGTG